MTDLRKAAEMAIEAFEDIKKYVTDDGAMPENWDAYHEKEYYALEALRQALAQPEQEKTCVSCGKPTMHVGDKCYGCCQTAQPEQEPINKMPTKIFGPNLEQILNNAGFYRLSEQKPKAWIYDGNLHIFDPTDWAIEPESVQPLYTVPPSKPWVSLTDEEVKSILDCGRGGLVDIRKAEQLLKERNT